MNANMQGSVGMLDGLLGNGNQNMPGILRRAKSSAAINKPLSGDVLRAFDDYNKDLAEAAQGTLQLNLRSILECRVLYRVGVCHSTQLDIESSVLMLGCGLGPGRAFWSSVVYIQ